MNTIAPATVLHTGDRQWDRLQRMSARLLGSIGGAAHSSGADDDRWYVRREIETALLDRIVDPAAEPQIVVGDAGHGKSTLLWSLHRALDLRGEQPLLVSATWLQRGGDGTALLSSADITDAVVGRPRSILLLDTADLLLHSPAARAHVLDLVDTLSRARIPVVLTTRALEWRHLPPDLGHTIRLGPYSRGTELPSAIEAMVAEFCTDGAAVPTAPVAAIISARARGTLVDDVCTSPLLLRLLFSLSAPQFPHLELDVTGLYNLFWARRIVDDHRGGTDVPTFEGADLSETAGFAAIAMLALGTPDPILDDLVRRTVQAAAASGHRLGPGKAGEHIRELGRRGVLIAADNRIRFFHQTFFEFAAARGLAARGADTELPRLIARITAAPDDLFLGAVIEQTLIILGSDPLARPTAAASCRALIDTGHPGLISIALTMWAHHPTILDLNAAGVIAVGEDQLRRFLRTVPRVHSHTESVADHLAALWNELPAIRTAIVTTAAHLAGRSPAAIADLVRRTAMYTELADNHQPYLRSNSEPQTLLHALSSTDPDLVRTAVVITIDALTDPHTQQKTSTKLGKQAVARYLHVVAEEWNALHDSAFLETLNTTIGAAQARSGDSDAYIVRGAYAQVIAADIRHRHLSTGRDDLFIDWVHRLCSALEREGGDKDPITGAELLALGRILAGLDPPLHPSVIDAAFTRMFALAGAAAPRQLARGALTPILTADTPARTALIVILSRLLDGHLPAEHQNFTPGPALWAAVARQAIWDASIPVDVVHSILGSTLNTHAGNEQLFTTGHHLVALAPAASMWGEPAALAAAHTLAHIDIRAVLEKKAANTFLDRARDRAHQQPEHLIPAALPIARRVDRTGIVKDLLEYENTHAVLRAHATALTEWIDELITGADNHQQNGADVLRLLTERTILTPLSATLLAWFEQVRNPESKANLLITIAISARHARTSHPETVELLSRFVSVTAGPTPTIHAPTTAPSHPVIVEAARTALLETLAHRPSSFTELWPTIHALTFAPRLNGTHDIDMAGIEHLARFLRTEAETGSIDDAIAHLAATCTSLTPLDKNLRVTASNTLKGAVAAIVRRARSDHYDQLAALIGTAPGQTATQLIHGLLDSPLFAERARTYGHHLNVIPRVIGTGTFPDILIPVPVPVPVPVDSAREQPGPPASATVSVSPAHSGDAAAAHSPIDAAHRHLAAVTRDFEDACDNAFGAIRHHEGHKNNTTIGAKFGVSRSTFEGLKASANWRKPSPQLCLRIDDYSARLPRRVDLTGHLEMFIEAQQALKDAQSQRRL